MGGGPGVVTCENLPISAICQGSCSTEDETKINDDYDCCLLVLYSILFCTFLV